MGSRSASACFLLIFSVATLGATSPARVSAQSGEAAARAHYERGVALYDEGQFAAALAEFEAAYAGSRRASILFNIGQIQARLGRAVEAAEILARYLEEGGAAISAERRALVEAEIRTQSARIATIEISVSVPGATVTFDDVEVGQAPLGAPVRAAAGEHVIVARAEGFEPARFRFRIAGGESRTVPLELLPHAEGAARLRLVIGVPGAEVRVDGRSVGLSPIELPIGLPEGQHRIEVTRPGYEPVERTVILPPSGEETLQLDLVRSQSAAPGVMTQLALPLPTTSHTIRVDGVEIPPGTSSLELPYGLHDLHIEAEHMVPVRQRIDVPQGPTYALDTRYQWAPAHREALRSEASAMRTGGLVTMIVGAVLGAGGAATLISRELHYESSRLGLRQEIVGFCNMVVPVDMRAAHQAQCDAMLSNSFPLEGDPGQFEAQTNRELDIREGLAVAGGVLVGVGAAAIIAGLVVFLLPPSDEQIDEGTTRGPSVSLDVGPGGLSLRGTF